MVNPEEKRLKEDLAKQHHWRRWGPYLTEREWGSVREDYSENGDAWNYFSFEQSASRVYRWGEDGIGGISDNHQRVCFSLAFWNEKDPILKERLFGLGGKEGNHGEDVKEYYYYLDSTPTHSFMKYLYKYPQQAFPYQKIKEENSKRGKLDPEYELIETGVFSENRYFDIFIEYAKKTAEDIFIKITIENRSSENKRLHVLPQIFFRNTWSFKHEEKHANVKGNLKGHSTHIEITHPELKERFLYFDGSPELLFTENETNFAKVFNKPNESPYVKDSFHSYIIEGKKEAINPAKKGTKAACHYILDVPKHKSVTLHLRFTDEKNLSTPFHQFNDLFIEREKEADEFFQQIQRKDLTGELSSIQRQAFANLLWNKQFYHYVVEEWLKGDDPKFQPPHNRKWGRNRDWNHLYNDDILSVPDKWEYPWFASWDLAFHMIPFSMIDPDFAKKQQMLLTREWYMHPNGQIPSYEWNFGDVNPPVHAWATWRVYKIEERWHGEKDTTFLASVFQKLLLNFTWWVNRKDADGKNVFQGGFLGLDNISVFNRSEDIPKGGTLTQSDATSWMGMYCLNMWTIASELAEVDSSYEDMASKFFEHFLYIADAINYQKAETPSLWDEEDGFYYDILHLPDKTHKRLKVHSLVGLIPLFAVAVLEDEKLNKMKGFKRRFEWFIENRPDLCKEIAALDDTGVKRRHLLSILDKPRLTRILQRMLSDEEFLSPYGIRSISMYHKDHPYHLLCDGQTHNINYEPGESSSYLFGGNSNWRGPIWFPLNFLIIESLQKFYHYYGDSFKIECPTGSNKWMTLKEVADEISKRLISIFLRNPKTNTRPLYGDNETFQNDPFWKDHILFYEYFHGNDGHGIGASHQGGWTALVAKLIQQQGPF